MRCIVDQGLPYQKEANVVGLLYCEKDALMVVVRIRNTLDLQLVHPSRIHLIDGIDASMLFRPNLTNMCVDEQPQQPKETV